MDNIFLQQAFYWRNQGERYRFANRMLRKLGLPFRLKPALDPQRDMTTLEARINFFHLAQQVALQGVAGDVAELGSYTGETAALLGEVFQAHAPDKRLHIFDSFEKRYKRSEPIRPVLERNLESRGCATGQCTRGISTPPSRHNCPIGCLSFISIAAPAAARLRSLRTPRSWAICWSTCIRACSPGGVLVLMDYSDTSCLP